MPSLTGVFPAVRRDLESSSPTVDKRPFFLLALLWPPVDVWPMQQDASLLRWV